MSAATLNPHCTRSTIPSDWLRDRAADGPRPDATGGSGSGVAERDWPGRRSRLQDLDLRYIDSVEFHEDDAEATILGPAVSRSFEKGPSSAPSDLPGHLARLCEAPLLTAEEEKSLFRQLNYLRFRAFECREQLSDDRPNFRMLLRAERYAAAAQQVRNDLIRANMRLVISVVKKYVTPQMSFDELLSDGIVTLMNAVDKFDYSRGFRFSTYAYRSIARNAFRMVTERQKEQTRYVGSPEEVMDEDGSVGGSSMNEKTWELLRSKLAGMLSHLDRREQFIIRGRYALGAHRKVRTFQSLADKLGVSKERARQLEQRAVAKLRTMAAEYRMDDLIDPALVN